MFEVLVMVMPHLVNQLSFGFAGFIGAVVGKVLSQDHVKLFEGRRFADATQPEEENGEVRMSDIDFSLGVVLDKFFDVHETELVGHFFLRRHWISQLPT